MFDLSSHRKIHNRSAGTRKNADFLDREIEGRLMDRMTLFRLRPSSILQCGDSEALSNNLLQLYPDADLVIIDPAEQRLFELYSSDDLKCSSYYSSLPFSDDSFDMVVSSLSLNWVNDFAASFREISRVLKQDGLLVFTLFGVQTLNELRGSFSKSCDYCYLFPDMHDIGDLLLQSGFEDPVMEMETITVRYKELKKFFEDLKLTGNSNVHKHRRKGLFGKRDWQNAVEHYESLKQDNAYPVSFEIIYGHAWKVKASEDQADGEVFVSIDSIR